MYRLATKHSERVNSWQASTADFRQQKPTSVWSCKWVSTHLILTTAIPANCL